MSSANRFWLSRSPSMLLGVRLGLGVRLAVELLVDAVLRDRDVELDHQGVLVLAQHVRGSRRPA